MQGKRVEGRGLSHTGVLALSFVRWNKLEMMLKPVMLLYSYCMCINSAAGNNMGCYAHYNVLCTAGDNSTYESKVCFLSF